MPLDAGGFPCARHRGSICAGMSHPPGTSSTRIGPVETSPRGGVTTRVLWGLLVLLWLGLCWLLSPGCTGKQIKLYSPATGMPLATYSNTTDSEIGGLEAEYDPSTGLFRVKVKSSSQAASESNAAAFAAINAAIEKIPAVK